MTANSAELPAATVRAEQAARIAAMFALWAVEDVLDDPDWDVDQIERVRFPSPPEAIEQSGP